MKIMDTTLTLSYFMSKHKLQNMNVFRALKANVYLMVTPQVCGVMLIEQNA